MIVTDFTPVQDWLLIRLEKPEKETEAGFLISDKKITPNKGLIVKAAEGTLAKEGQTVYLEKQNLHEIKLQGEVFYAIRERFIIGII